VLLENARVAQDGEKWILRARLEGQKASDVTDFYPDLTDGIIVEFRLTGVHQNELTVVFTRQNETLKSVVLKGLLVTNNAAYEIAIPIQFPSQ